ncbi:MAG: glycosyltransferase family 2 protein [Desulfoplanes sp.]|nr:glycosyltransferase family 2 protein [Desulfoplanes sp.]MDD4649119.1 glycosyltransferase family 2 protein [Desulfoplanes sp.]
MNDSITGVVLTLNGERHLDKCLQSLNFCSKIIVVDSQSTDSTPEIAKKHNAEFLVNPWQGPATQFEFAFKHVTTPWVISLDQDEIISIELQKSIMDALKNPSGGGFLCPRISFYFDRFIYHCGWYPDYLLRVFRLDQMRVHISGPHYGFRTTGTVQKLSGNIIHYPYKDIGEHIAKINSYTQIGAQDLFEKGQSSGVIKAFSHGIGRFIKIYFLKKGFLDGKAGFILAINSFFYAFNKYIRLYELNLTDKNKLSSPKST